MRFTNENVRDYIAERVTFFTAIAVARSSSLEFSLAKFLRSIGFDFFIPFDRGPTFGEKIVGIIYDSANRIKSGFAGPHSQTAIPCI